MASVPTPPRRGFDNPDENAGMHEARGQFFQAVHHIQPCVSGNLMGEPLDLFRAMVEHIAAGLPSERRDPRTWLSWDVNLSWSTFKHADEWQEARLPGSLLLRDLLHEWAHEWRLEDDWCLDAAVETLLDAINYGDARTARPLSYSDRQMIDLPFTDEELRFTFEDDGWTPTLEGWEQAAARMTQAFQQHLSAYQHRVEDLAHERGLTRPKQSRYRKGDHYEWLARHVVKRDTFSGIARLSGAKRQAVRVAVKKRAKGIGLTLP